MGRRMTATEILNSEQRRRADNRWNFMKLSGPRDLAMLAGALDYRQQLVNHFARVADMSYEDARALAKVVTHAAIYRVSPERLKEIMMDSCTITLDAGDKYMMKQMGMTEAEYEQFILDLLLEKYNLYQPKSPELPLIGKHYDQLIVDDIQQREENNVNQQMGASRPLATPAGLSAPYGVEGTETGRIRSVNPAGPLDARREAVNEAFGSLMAAQDEAMKQRSAIRSADPMQPDFAEMMMELHRRNQYYLSALQRYLDVTAFSTVMQAQAVGARS